jgi:hypothetical protein
MSDRSAIGGSGGLNNQMNKAVQEIENILSKYDWSGIDSQQHTEFTSKLYSVVQQSTDPKLQKNTRQGVNT